MGNVGSKAHFRFVRGRPSLTERTDATRTAHGDQREVSIMWDVGSETTFAHPADSRHTVEVFKRLRLKVFLFDGFFLRVC